MKLAKLHEFIAVIEAGSIGAAARKLEVSQPALTKSMKTLEARLELPLLVRTSRGVVPTRFGKVLYARAHAAHTELLRAEEELRELAGERAGSVAFGFGPVAAGLIVPQAVATFRTQFPDAAVRLMEGFVHHLVPLVREETLDFAIGPGLEEFRREAGLRFKPLFHYERVICARRGHPQRDARSLNDLRGARWLSFEPQGMLEKMFAGLGLPAPKPVVQSDSANASLGLIAATDVLGILPRPMLSTSTLVQKLAVAEPLPTFTVGIFTRADTPLTRAASVMAKALAAVGRRVASRSGSGS
jgi:LysR family transcriptional regulator, regulator of abg operon